MAKLSDSSFYAGKAKTKQRKVSALEIKTALSPTAAFEQAFDMLAQMGMGPGVGGPMMPPSPGASPIEQQINELKSKGFTDDQVKEVIKTSQNLPADGNNPDGTANHPINDEKAPLFTPEVPGTGKLGELIASVKMSQIVGTDEKTGEVDSPKDDEPKDEKKPEKKDDDKEGQADYDENPSFEKAPKKDNPPEKKDEPAPAPEKKPDAPAPEKKPDAPAAPSAPQEQHDVKDLMQDKSLEDQKKVMASFLAYVNQIHQKWMRLRELLVDQKNPPRERAFLQRQLAGLQVQISKAGSMYKRLVKLMARAQELQIPQGGEVLLEWLRQQTEQRPSPMTQPMKPKPENTVLTPDQITKMKPGPGPSPRPDATELKPSKPVAPELRKTQSKEAQMPQPPPPPGGAPPPPAAPGGAPPPPGAPPPGEGAEPEQEMEDNRTLEQVMEDLKKDVEALTQKVEGGDAMLDGEEVEPVHEDTGATPGPPPKIAVDQPAKQYYHDLYGDYGDQLVKDRVAETIGIIDEVAGTYKMVLTNEQVQNLVAFLTDMDRVEADTLYAKAAAVASGHAEFADTLDRLLVNFMFKSGAINTKVAVEHKPTLFVIAANSIPKIGEAVLRYIEAADSKMKQPKVKGQPDDAVKPDLKLKDNAKDQDREDLARPAHLPMHVSKKKQSGDYIVMEVSWDPDHPAAMRSGDGMEQAVKSFMKGMESEKEFLDLGYCGEFNVTELDPEAGFAEVRFYSRRKNNAPLNVTVNDT